MKITTFFLILITILIFSGTASAESGSISVAGYKTMTDYIISGGGATALNAPVWTNILIDNTNFNTFDYFKAYNPAWTFTHDSESTSFTIVSGGTNQGNGGYVSYNKTAKTVTWFFNTITLTSNEIVLSYSTNIFANVSGGSYPDAQNRFPVFDKMAIIKGTNGGGFEYATQLDATSYTSSGSVTTTNNYIVTYPTPTTFNIVVSKLSIPTKVIVHSVSSTYVQDASPTTFPLSFTGVYGNGLYINVTLAGGAYHDVLINSSTAGPTGQGTITTDKNNYIIGESPIITWNILNANAAYSYFLVETNPINNTRTISSNIAISGSVTNPHTFDVAGTWKESIIALNNSCTGPTYYCWIPGDILNTYVSVSTTQPSLLANITANKSTYAYHETWNFTVKAIGTNKYIVKAYDPNGQLFAGFPSPAVSGNQTLLYTPSAYTLGGTWTAKVYDIVNAQYVAQTTFIINPTQGGYYVGQIHILEGSIDLNVQEYFTVAYTSNGTGTITIKKPDGSTYTTYLSINGSGQDIITLSSSADVGYWSAVLVDSANIYTSQVYVTKGGATTSQNGSFTIFTDKTAYLRGDIVQATYRFPANYNNISVVVYDANNQKMVSALRPAPEAQLFGYASITIGTTGTNGNWKITLEDFNKTEYASAVFTVNSPTPTTGTAQSAANLFNVFTYIAFYGMVIFIGIFYSAIKLMTAHGAQVNGQALVIVMALIATMEALVGLFDPFKIYIIVITWIFAAIYFRQTRAAATGDQ